MNNDDLIDFRNNVGDARAAVLRLTRSLQRVDPSAQLREHLDFISNALGRMAKEADGGHGHGYYGIQGAFGAGKAQAMRADTGSGGEEI